jgi:hypothetical protein
MRRHVFALAAGAAALGLAAACGTTAASNSVPPGQPGAHPSGYTGSPAPVQVFLDFTCTMDQPGVSDDYAVDVANPSASSISMGVVTLNFSDAAGNVIDTENYVPNGAIVIPAGGSAVVRGEASESSSPPSSCQETGWQQAL